MSVATLTAEQLKPALTDGAEIAFLDVREHGQYGEGHPFFSVPIPYSVLEDRARRLLPNRTVRCVLGDDGDGVAIRAQRVLADLGYQDVSILVGGMPGWAAAGYTLYKGVNVPSKTFGELVEHELATPSISAVELSERRAAGESFICFDGRTPKEYERMTIPGAGCCPNAELAYRLHDVVRDASTPIVMSCAGRTRSIIGAETLRQLGVTNPVFALENGTQGWKLAGFELAYSNDAGLPAPPSQDELANIRAIGERLIAQHGLPTVDTDALSRWLEDDARTTYVLDVRTAEEFAASHWPGAVHAPGGQLVQATDQYVAVRNARLVLYDNACSRAAVTAMWLRGMGHDAYVLVAHDRELATPDAGLSSDSSSVTAAQARALYEAGALFVDASRSDDYRRSHIRGAHWVTRARVGSLPVTPERTVVVTGRTEALVLGVASELAAAEAMRVETYVASEQEWRNAGFETVSSPDTPADTDCIDYLFFVHDRHDGNLDAARAYLEWETGLLAQLDAQERGVLTPPRASRST